MSKILYKNENGEFVELPFLKGDKGDTGESGADGKSAYQIALDNGFVGSQSEWLASLKGEKGDKGDKGDSTTVVDNLESDSSEYALSAKQGKLLNDSISRITTDIGNLGGGDMMKAMYDKDGNGKVDKADDTDKFDGQLPSYYAKASDLNSKVNNSVVGQANGVASLDENGKILSTQLPNASANTLGGVKIGTNLSIDKNGILSADAQKMTVDNTLDSNSENPVQHKVVKNALDGKSDTTHNHDGTYLKEVPMATKNTLGVIKVGTGLSVTNDGILSADAQAINVTPLITQNSDEAVSSGAVFSRIGNLKFVVSPTPPTDADGNTFTIVVPN